jgi:hypothetical protein
VPSGDFLDGIWGGVGRPLKGRNVGSSRARSIWKKWGLASGPAWRNEERTDMGVQRGGEMVVVEEREGFEVLSLAERVGWVSWVVFGWLWSVTHVVVWWRRRRSKQRKWQGNGLGNIYYKDLEDLLVIIQL